MQRHPLLILAIVFGLGLALPASAQWKWRDKTGVIHYSDLPPPQGIPAQDVLQRSSAGRAPVVAAAAASAPASAAPFSAAPAPRGDPELEARRGKVEQEKADKAKAEERVQAERIAAAKAENCMRARSHMKTLEDGMRMVRTNASGEREVLDDKGRAEEKARAREVISSDCR
ncbi:MAG: DUF4124 domain-containing protein [Burkholderiaceae bacterium]